MYAAIGTRPDIQFAVTYLSQFLANPSETHWKAVGHIYRYLQGSPDKGITYDMLNGGATFEPTGYTDSDNGKSFQFHALSGGVILLAGGSIKWISKKQDRISLSTMDAEYVAAVEIARGIRWVTQFLEELNFPLQLPIALNIDNQTAKRLAENPEMHKRSQHIERRHHWIREQVDIGNIELFWRPGDENPADLFTKSLPPIKFNHHRDYGLGMYGPGGVLKNDPEHSGRLTQID